MSRPMTLNVTASSTHSCPVPEIKQNFVIRGKRKNTASRPMANDLTTSNPSELFGQAGRIRVDIGPAILKIDTELKSTLNSDLFYVRLSTVFGEILTAAPM
ncbi:hypothetical protein RRG08_050662 [Elysia crispata]|uniref:Uncharacterized protein n=1 Tax=Elysia crispata TaxID=231223 RepID=A0AAE1AE61_9GAST|nr:hypothetical protein RRG08_050662 [Elysia crispata]